jgi:hypothetical protein
MFVHLYNGLSIRGCSTATAINFPLPLSYFAVATSCNSDSLFFCRRFSALISCSGDGSEMSHRSRGPRRALPYGGCRWGSVEASANQGVVDWWVRVVLPKA